MLTLSEVVSLQYSLDLELFSFFLLSSSKSEQFGQVPALDFVIKFLIIFLY